MARILANYQVRSFTDPRAALEYCASPESDILIADQKMPYITGIELAKRIREQRDSHLSIIVSGYTDSDDLVDAVNSNVMHKYIVKPFSAEVLLQHVRRAEEFLRLDRDKRALETLLTQTNARLLQENDRLRGEGRSVLDSFVGYSPAIMGLKALAAQYALSDRPVLIAGETGTGKELLARAIHALSPRHDKPFIAINAASLPESLFKASSSGSSGGRSPGQRRTRRVSSLSRTEEPCSSTRLASCPCRRSPSSSGCSSSARSSRWEARKRRRSTSA